ncbi:hypothetical protein G195_011234 [Phytophthora kernoviae 00238/432]|nr:hypothetical protein G195_011234 [Phytophthora kernoviae 00238/432]
MKPLKLQDAREFFGRRLSHLSPLKSMSEDYRFENDDGDYWAVRFATSHVSEKMGHLTVREDDDNGEPGITHNRLVSVTGKGLRMESNTIVFSEYHEAEAGEQGGYGMIVVDFADEDKRYPYRPNERIRKDVNTVMEVRSCSRRVPASSSCKEENVVVLTRWSHSRLRHPKFAVPRDGWLELRESMDRWSQNLHKTVMESLDPTTQGPPTWRLDA